MIGCGLLEVAETMDPANRKYRLTASGTSQAAALVKRMSGGKP
jgi:hypothetical protein